MCGLISVLCPIVVLSVVAFLLYGLAMRQIRNNSQLRGEGLATAGLVLGIVGLSFSLPCLFCGGLLPVVSWI